MWSKLGSEPGPPGNEADEAEASDERDDNPNLLDKKDFGNMS